MILVGPSLGSAVAIDFAINHPEAVCAIKSFKFLNVCNNPIFKEILYLEIVLSCDSHMIWSFFQVEKLVLMDASVYAEGTGNLATLPRSVAYAGVSMFCTP